MPKDLWKRPETDTWYVNIWDPIRKIKIKKAVGTNKRKAQEVAAQVRAQMVNNSLGIRVPCKAPTLDEFIPVVLDRHYGDKTCRPKAARALRLLRGFTGNIPISGLTKGVLSQYVAMRLKSPIEPPFHSKNSYPESIERWREKNKRLVSKSTTNREISYIMCAVNRAVEWDILAFNPLAGFKKAPEKDRRRRKYLKEPELKAFLKAASELADKAFYDIVRLAIYTGRRRTEILSLKKSDYDSKNGYLHLAETKKGEAELIPVPSAVQEILNRRYRDINSEWFFPNDANTRHQKDVGTAFHRAVAAAGLSDFKFHDLRHTAISYQIMAGVDYFTVASLAGHTTPTMIETVYGHLSPKHKEASAVIYGTYMDRLTGRTIFNEDSSNFPSQIGL